MMMVGVLGLAGMGGVGMWGAKRYGVRLGTEYLCTLGWSTVPLVRHDIVEYSVTLSPLSGAFSKVSKPQTLRLLKMMSYTAKG